MGFCSEAEYLEFLHSCPEFERMLVRSGIILVKYWFSVSDEEQEHRFQERMHDVTKRWKLSAMDLESRRRWVEYSRQGRDVRLRTSSRLLVRGECGEQEEARLNVISTCCNSFEDHPQTLKLPPR